jgi:predicted O-linked N-acetylglucosamine transferase (SPINDLY family)
MTDQLESLADHFQDVSGESDEGVVEAVRGDQIDILIDLAGHTANNRLTVFARRPAPVQASGMGYVNTTGLSAMDYLISDHHQTPEGVDGLYTETLARLPRGYITYTAPEYIPDVSPLPAQQKGHLTLGCMNRLAKLTPETLKLWGAVLEAVPTATLYLQTNGLEDRDLARQLVHRLVAEGVSPGRVTLAGGAGHADFLRAYHAVDIALDPVPYSGGLVTCEALWMGVPVVTLKGERFASLHSTSHLRNAGLPDWVADTPGGYIALVKSWSERLPELSRLRAGLRAQVQASPLGDGAQYAHDFDSFLQESWRTWCTEQKR